MTQTDDTSNFTFGDVEPVSTIKTEAPIRGTSYLDEVRAELQKKVSKKPITLVVNTRQDFAVRYDVNIDANLVNTWRSRSEIKKGGRIIDFDILKFSLLIVNNTCEAITFKGNDIEDNGAPMKFVSRSLWQMLGAMDTNAALRGFFGQDSHLIAHANAVLEEAGYTDDGQVKEVDEDESPLG